MGGQEAYLASSFFPFPFLFHVFALLLPFHCTSIIIPQLSLFFSTICQARSLDLGELLFMIRKIRLAKSGTQKAYIFTVALWREAAEASLQFFAIRQTNSKRCHIDTTIQIIIMTSLSVGNFSAMAWHGVRGEIGTHVFLFPLCSLLLAHSSKQNIHSSGDAGSTVHDGFGDSGEICMHSMFLKHLINLAMHVCRVPLGHS